MRAQLPAVFASGVVAPRALSIATIAHLHNGGHARTHASTLTHAVMKQRAARGPPLLLYAALLAIGVGHGDAGHARLRARERVRPHVRQDGHALGVELEAGRELLVVDDLHPRNLWNGFIASPPRHPALLRAIGLIRSNVRRCARTATDLGVTGPLLWYQAAHPFSPSTLGQLEACPAFHGCTFVRNLLKNKIPSYVDEFWDMGYTPKLKYGYMWSRGVIYAPQFCKLADFARLFWL